MVGVHVCVPVNLSSWAPVELWLPCLCCFLLLAVICGLCPVCMSKACVEGGGMCGPGSSTFYMEEGDP